MSRGEILEALVALEDEGVEEALSLLAEEDDEEFPAEVLEEEVRCTDHFWTTQDDRIVLTTVLLDGLVLTHRVTAPELEAQELEVVPDLDVLTSTSAFDDLVFHEDGSPEECFEQEGWGDTAVLLSGTNGWLGDLAPGDLVARRDERRRRSQR